LDFGDAPVFTSIAYPAILVTQKTRSVELGQLPKNVEQASCLSGNVAQASCLPDSVEQASCLQQPQNQAGSLIYSARVMTWNPRENISEFPAIFERNAFTLAQRDLKPDGWRMESQVNLRLLEKLRKAGMPLGEYVKGQFYYGIKTGLNEAFVVDRATRDRLIAEHPSSEEILKPFLRGRDVKRWQVEFAGQYLIKIESSENKQHPWSGKPEKEAEKIFAKTYPAIHGFFDKMRKPLIKRCDQGKYFWELRSCDYWQEFEQPKVIFGRFMDKPTYAYDSEGYYHNDALYFASRVSSFVAAIMNSPVNWWFLSQICTDLQNGYLQALRQYQEQIPIPPATPQQKTELEKLVEKILSAKKANPSADVLALESEIDQIVYKLYGLTDEEIGIVEQAGGK